MTEEKKVVEQAVVGDYEIRGNQYIAIAINVNNPEDSHYFGIDPEVNNNAFVAACGWAYEPEQDKEVYMTACFEREEKIKAIKAWALQHYSEGGSWIIETHTDEEIDHEFETLGDAMKYCSFMKEREEEYRNA